MVRSAASSSNGRRDSAWLALLLAASLVIAAGIAYRVLAEASLWRDRATLESALATEAIERIELLRALGRTILLESDPTRRAARAGEARALSDQFETQASTTIATALRVLERTSAGEGPAVTSEAWGRFEEALAGAARAQAARLARQLAFQTGRVEGALRYLVAWTLAGGLCVSGLASFACWRRAVMRVARLERLAMTDELSGLPNRRASRRVGLREFERNCRYQRGLSLILFDIDDFKRINDTHGHAVGDQAIAAFARLLRASLRGADFAAREGGEEFLLIVPEVDLASAVRLADRLRRDTLTLGLRAADGALLALRVSAGVASARATDASFEALLRRADQALYAAKRAGRNRVCADTGRGDEAAGREWRERS